MKWLLLEQYYWLPVLPVVLIVVGGLSASLVRRGRWAIHLIFIVAMFVLPGFSIHLREIADPTLIEGPGPGDGLVMLLYLFVLVPILFAYVVMIIAMRADRSRSELASPEKAGSEN